MTQAPAPSPAKGTLKEQQSDRTRAALLAAARELFAEKGFAGTSTEEVVRRAGMTRGALYHQFRDKRALFEAVLDAVCEEVFERGRELSRRRAIERGGARRSMERHEAALELAVQSLLDPVLHRLLLVEGPSVLGPETLHRMVERHFLARVRGGFAAYQRAGLIDPGMPERAGDLLLGLVVEAARQVATADDPERTRAEVLEALLWIWRRLEPRPSAG